MSTEKPQSIPFMKLTVRNEVEEQTSGGVAVIDIETDIGEPWWWDDDTVTKEAVKSQLKAIEEIGAQTIVVNINSYGGDIDHGISIHDALAEQKAKGRTVVTRVRGFTASAATIVAQAASKGRREMSDNAYYLVHRSWSWAVGNVNQLDELRETLDTIDNGMADLYAKRGGGTREQYLELMDAKNGGGKWLSAADAKNNRLIDKTFDPAKHKVAAAATPTNTGTPNFKALGMPEIPTLMADEKPKKKLLQAALDKLKASTQKKKEKAEEDGVKLLDDAEVQAQIEELQNQINALSEEEPAADPDPEPSVDEDPEDTAEDPAEPEADPKGEDEESVSAQILNELKAFNKRLDKLEASDRKSKGTKTKGQGGKDDPTITNTTKDSNAAAHAANAAALKS